MRKINMALLMPVIFMIFSGCAFMNRNNTPLLNLTENYLVPRTRPARVISYPVTIPVSLVAVSADILLVHPVRVIEDAALDTKDIWDIPASEWEQQYITSSVSFLPRAVATPLFFTGDWLARSLFDIPRKAPERLVVKRMNRSEDIRAENIAQLKTSALVALRAGNYDEALILADKLLNAGGTSSVKLSVLIMTKNVAVIAASPGLVTSMKDVDIEYIDSFSKLITESSPEDKIRLLTFINKNSFNIILERERFDPIVNAVVTLVNGEDRAVAVVALNTLGKFKHVGRVREAINKIIEKNDPVMSMIALLL
jgi:hypothetical protein